MRILLISLVVAEILLVDDLNLKNSAEGLASLENIFNNLKNNFGETVNVIKPGPSALQNPNSGNWPIIQVSEPVAKLKTTFNQPISQVRSNFIFDPNSGRKQIAISRPLNEQNRPLRQNPYPNNQAPFRPPKPFPPMPPRPARVIFPPGNAFPLYQSIIPTAQQTPNKGNFNQTTYPKKEVLSPIYFPNISKKQPPIPEQYKQLNDTVKPNDFKVPSKSIQNTKPETQTKTTPPVEIEPFNVEVSTPDIDKEIEEELFDGDISGSASKKPKVPSRPNKSKKAPQEILSDEIEGNPPKKPEHKAKDTIPKEIQTVDDMKGPLEESSSKEEKTSKVTRTKTKTKKITTTKTATVTERHEVSGDQEKVEPADTTSLMPSKSEVKKEQDEALKSVVPRLLGKKFILKHNKDILSADKARRAYIDYKLSESKDKQNRIEKKLDSLKDLDDKLANKISKLINERSEIKQKATSDKNKAENNENTVKTLIEDQKKTENLMKLEEVEISKLEKALNKERNKYLVLNDQQNIYKDRLESFNKKGNNSKTDVKINENKLAEYDRLLNQIQRDHENLKSKIQEIEKQRRREIEAQNKLEIEKKEIEDSNHIPLFAIYD